MRTSMCARQVGMTDEEHMQTDRPFDRLGAQADRQTNRLFDRPGAQTDRQTV